MTSTFTADVFFCHQQLLMSLVDSRSLAALQRDLRVAPVFDGPLKAAYTNRLLIDSLFAYLKRSKIPAFEEVNARQNLTAGMPLWLEGAFYFKGVSKALKTLDKGSRPSYFQFQYVADELPGIRIFGELNAEHLFSTSASVALSGRQRKFMVATVRSNKDNQIELRPIFVGDRLFTDRQFPPFQLDDLEVDVAHIDEFAQIRQVDIKDPSLNLKENKQIEEAAIKRYFAEIIGERYVPKDWGGEASDLFTRNLHLSGKKIKAAFLFKGPSSFHPLKISDLGKNGDQVSRLFDEPADLFIVQHCHHITSPVVKHVVAYASRPDRMSHYCLIDGIDTQRILRAYSKI